MFVGIVFVEESSMLKDKRSCRGENERLTFGIFGQPFGCDEESYHRLAQASRQNHERVGSEGRIGNGPLILSRLNAHWAQRLHQGIRPVCLAGLGSIVERGVA